jgi:hypothetical protein
MVCRMAGDRVRDEAERLVATALAALSYATRGLGGARPGVGGWATGSAECCVCPVCRAIAAVREPNADLADRLASGVGDLATGVTSILRTLSQRAARAEAAHEPAPGAEGEEFWENLRRKAADAARAAARARSTMDSDDSTMDGDPWRVATAPAPAPRPSRSPAAKKAVAEPAVAKKAVAKKAVAKKAVAKKAVAKKAAVAEPVQPRKQPAPRASQRAGASQARAAGAGGRGARRTARPEGTA